MTEAVRLARLLCVDQRARWQRGEQVGVEAYLEQNPELHDDSEGLLDLIYTEVVLRQQAGEAPCLAEYLGRFPRFEESLRLLFEVHNALEKGSPPSGSGRRETPPWPTTCQQDERSAEEFSPKPDVSLPGYEVLSELGRGGMGIVYKAQQTRPQRLVAVKMLLAGVHASPTGLSRFRAEAEAVARLSHPNIVQIFEVGEHGGLPFFSMEYVEGKTLTAWVNSTPQPADEAARIVATLARAIHAAHLKGVIHRDLKPANILLGDDGAPKITDFGLAKTLDEAGLSGTRSGEVMGTPSYMAPEQAAGRNKNVGPATDVYAVGAILYELLTGRPPFKAETTTDTLLQVLHQGPVPPSRLRVKTPRDLETICLKCLEKDINRRYASALDLADDLTRFLDGRPVVARPVSLSGRALKWARRRPSLAATLAVCGLALAVSLVTVAHHTASERSRTAQAREETRETLRKGRQAWFADDWTAARSYFDEVLSRVDGEPSLADLRPEAAELLAGAERRLAQQADSRYAEQTRLAFLRSSDKALFHGMNAMAGRNLFTGLDPANHRAAARVSALEALTRVGLDPSAQTRALDRRFRDPAQRAEITAGCFTLLLVLADVVANTGPQDEANRCGEALRILEQASRLRPPSRIYHLRRARYLLRCGDSSAAERERGLADVAVPADALDHLLLGDDFYRQQDLPRAVQKFESAVNLQPNHFWAQCYLGVCHLKMRQWRLARSCFTVCLALRPRLVWPHILRGYANREVHAWSAAEVDFGRAAALLERQPDDSARYGLLVNRGSLRLDQKMPEQAAADFLEAERARPAEYLPHVNLAEAYQRLKRPVDADRQIRLAVDRGAPPFVLAGYEGERAIQLNREGKHAQAVKWCRSALSRQPDHTVVRGVLAHSLLRQHRYKEAIAEFDLYLKDGGKRLAAVYAGRGTARKHLGDFLGACDDFTQAMAWGPDAELYLHRGEAHFFVDAWRPALSDFDAAVRLNPNSSDAYVGRGLARVMLGGYRAAVLDAEEAWKRKPASPEWMLNLACVYALALARAQADPTAQDRLARAAEYRKRSLEALQKTLDLVPAVKRAAFWREKMAPDSALASVRPSAEFQQLQKKYGSP